VKLSGSFFSRTEVKHMLWIFFIVCSRYLGHPDLIPIRTDEFTFGVRMLHRLSTKINEKWGETIADVYHRNAPAGAICRQVAIFNKFSLFNDNHEVWYHID
jgi:hypothetical protein